VIQDYEIVLQLEDSSWIWSQTQNGSFDIRPGEVAFIPPNYAHAWGANSGSHLAVHFDLHAQPTLSALETFVCSKASFRAVQHLWFRVLCCNHPRVRQAIPPCRSETLWYYH
jgi:hypothetical protein